MAISARIDELRKKFDENPRRYFAPLANEYRKAGDPGQAIFICETYLPQQPGHMSGHIVFGQALYELNRLEEARSVFETALSLDPENLIALRHLGDIARKTGENTAARNWYQRVLEADPRNEEIAQIVASLAFAPDTHASEPTPDAAVTAETPTTLIMEPPVLPKAPEIQRTPARGSLGLVEHFDTSLSAPAMAPPPFAPPSLSASGALFDLTDNAPLEARMSGPGAQVRHNEPPSIPEPSFSGTQPSLPTPPFELTAVTDANASTDDLTFEADSLAITAKAEPQTAAPVEDDGHLDGAFVDESAFEPFSLGLPIPQFDEAPAANVAETPAVNVAEAHAAPVHATSAVSNAALSTPVTEEPPPLPFVELPAAEAIAPPPLPFVELPAAEAIAPPPLPFVELPTANVIAPPKEDEADALAADEDDELAMFLARHTQHTGIPTPPSVAAQPAAGASPTPTVEPPSLPEPVFEAEHVSAIEPVSAVEPMSAAEPVSVAEAAAPIEDASPVEHASPALSSPVEPTPTESVAAVSAHADSIDAPAVPGVDETLTTPLQLEPVAEAAPEIAEAPESLAPPMPVWGELTTPVATLDAPVDEVHAEASTPEVAAETPTHAESVVESSALEIDVAAAVESVGSTPDEIHIDAREDSSAETPVVSSAAIEPAEPPAVSEPAGPPEAFVTETMAELYLQQGHLEPALDIYKKLVEQRPDDPQLKERLGAIERNLHGTHAAAASVDEPVAEPAVVGPTIRDFLSVFATRAKPVTETPHEDAGAVSQYDDASEVAGTATAEATGHASEEIATTSAHSSGEHGSIDSLFHNADAHVIDVNAATVLAEAFAPDDGRAVRPIVDQASNSSPAPTTHAQPPATEASGDGFSFDQFFARDAARTSQATPRDSQSAPGDAADVAQFNQWLSGLKKPS